MSPSCNPVHKRGDRNVLCTHYRECLDHAVKRSWEYWDCGKCQNKENQGARPEMRFLACDEVAYYEVTFEA